MRVKSPSAKGISIISPAFAVNSGQLASSISKSILVNAVKLLTSPVFAIFGFSSAPTGIATAVTSAKSFSFLRFMQETVG